MKKIDWNKQREAIANYIYTSMCVDGFVVFYRFDDIEIMGEKKKGMIFQVRDKVRGKFYIGWYK